MDIEKQEQLKVLNDLKDLELELRIQEGKYPILIDNLGYIKQYKLTEINKIGYLNYNYLTNLLCVDLEDIKKTKFDNVYNWIYDQCCKSKESAQSYVTALALYFNENVSFSNEVGFFIGKIEERRIINKNNFEQVQKIIKIINCYKKKDKEEIKFANKKAEEMWNKIQENQKKLQKIIKNKSNLSSLISGVAWKSGMHEKVWDLTLYQLYDGVARLGLINNIENTYTGIYSGAINAKEVNQKDLDWTKIINNN